MNIDEIIKTADNNPEFILFQFKDWDKEKRDKYTEGFYDKNPQPDKCFDGFGLRYDPTYLAELGTNVVLFPVEFMANYVDGITKGKVDSQDRNFILELKDLKTLTEPEFIELNATSIGNMAYAYMNTKDEELKNIIKAKLIEIFKWKFNQYRKIIESLRDVN